MQEYTDIDNTGLAAVPDLSTDIDPRDHFAETVLSHRLDTDD